MILSGQLHLYQGFIRDCVFKLYTYSESTLRADGVLLSVTYAGFYARQAWVFAFVLVYVVHLDFAFALSWLWSLSLFFGP